MVTIKKKSKRISTKTRVKIEKKVREHNRKKRKEAKKNPKKGKRKDPGIPNSLPFKDEVIKEMEAVKEKKDQERQKKKDRQKKNRERLQNQKRNLASVMRDGEKAQAAYDKQVDNSKTKLEEELLKVKTSAESSRKTFYKEFHKVVEAADVILEVLDARDPLGSRCREMEAAVRSAGGVKKVILVLNKIDLVPKENVQAWLKHLRLELPAVAFKASTQEQKDRLKQSKIDYFVANDEVLKSSYCLGADVLMKLLKNYCRETEMSINVGVVGFPNTGKSSIINSLKRSRVCDVGSVPGITRAMQGVQLDKHIKLLDSPGVVMATATSDVAAVLRNVVKVEDVEDPVPCVEAILSRCQKVQMQLQYNLPEFGGPGEFLQLLAIRTGKLRKGGVPDVNKAARALLKDWNSGKITYYTAPPEKEDSKNTEIHVGASIVTGFSKEFDINDICQEEEKMLEDLPSTGATHMLVPAFAPLSAVNGEDELEEKEKKMAGDDEDDYEEEEDEEEDMEECEDSGELKGVNVVLNAGKNTNKKMRQVAPKDFRHKGPQARAPLKTIGGLISRTDKRKQERREKKKKKKAGKVADSLSKALSAL